MAASPSSVELAYLDVHRDPNDLRVHRCDPVLLIKPRLAESDRSVSTEYLEGYRESNWSSTDLNHLSSFYAKSAVLQVFFVTALLLFGIGYIWNEA